MTPKFNLGCLNLSTIGLGNRSGLATRLRFLSPASTPSLSRVFLMNPIPVAAFNQFATVLQYSSVHTIDGQLAPRTVLYLEPEGASTSAGIDLFVAGVKHRYHSAMQRNPPKYSGPRQRLSKNPVRIVALPGLVPLRKPGLSPWPLRRYGGFCFSFSDAAIVPLFTLRPHKAETGHPISFVPRSGVCGACAAARQP
jgi:hypothetical protein